MDSILFPLAPKIRKLKVFKAMFFKKKKNEAPILKLILWLDQGGYALFVCRIGKLNVPKGCDLEEYHRSFNVVYFSLFFLQDTVHFTSSINKVERNHRLKKRTSQKTC